MSGAGRTMLSQRDAVREAILHERQEPGSMLCAQHCLNNLMQSHTFDAAGLADVAKQLDDVERSHLDLDDTQWAQREAQSRNADETGFFSVGVVETALQVWGLSLVRWGSQAMRQHQDRPEDQLAFVLNLDSHWFCFRSFGVTGDVWFNLNSFLEEPSWVGSGYLGALLHQAAREGYSVFVVRTTEEEGLQSQAIVDQFRASSADEAASAALKSAARISGDSEEDEQLKLAIAASLAYGSTGLTPASTADVVASSSSAATAADQPRPPLNEGKRRRSRRQGDDDIHQAHDTSIRARSRLDANTANLSGLSSAGRQTGQSRENAIALGDDDEADMAEDASLSRSPFLDPTLRSQLIEGDDEDDDDLEELPQALLSTPAMTSSGRHIPNAPQRRRLGDRNRPIELNDGDDDDDDSLAALDMHEEELHRSFTAAAQAFSQLQDRDYDDEDAELQRALAASMQQGSPQGLNGSSRDDWLAAEDPEQQARILAEIAGRASTQEDSGTLDRHYRSPTPADVGRIAKMREEAKQREKEAQERDERHARGEFTPEPQPETQRKQSSSDDDDDDDEEAGDDSAADQKPLSAEELRRMRLARFGG
ncbi:unnamed protein product [Parajaminaea phylloscopi]